MYGVVLQEQFLQYVAEETVVVGHQLHYILAALKIRHTRFIGTPVA